MLPGSVVCVPVLSVTATVKVNVPRVVGVPDRPAGGDAASLKPGGICPETIDQAYGCTPPSAKKFVWYAEPTVPAGQQEPDVMTRGSGGSMESVKACRAVCPAPSVTCSVNVEVPVCLGVPAICAEYTPKLFIDKPDGRLPETSFHVYGVGPEPPLEVTYSLKNVPTFPGPRVQTPLVHEKPAVITMSGWGVAVGGGVVEAWSVSVGCAPVGVGVGVGAEPVGVEVGVGSVLVGVGVGEPWRAERGSGMASVSRSKLATMTPTITFFITKLLKMVVTVFMIHLVFQVRLKLELLPSPLIPGLSGSPSGSGFPYILRPHRTYC
jgi:hypothetical protein